MSKFLREPLFHFLAIGLVIFCAYALLNPGQGEADDVNTIVIDGDTTQRLAAQFQEVWRRPPTTQEMEGLIDATVREEVMVREALLLSMDQDDAIIRRRLAQKMEFLLESAAGAQVADAADLKAHFDANKLNYAEPPRIAFEQVYLGENPSEDDTKAALQILKDGGTPQTPRTLLPASIPVSQSAAVDGLLGRGVFEALEQLPLGEWAGPIRSGYGFHLIRVTERMEPAEPDFDSVRDRVEADWRAARAESLRNEVYARMAENYQIIRPSEDELTTPTQ